MNPFELIPPDIQPLIISAATALGTTYLSKGENGPIQTLSDLWYLSGIGNLHEKVLDERQKRALLRENQKSVETAKSVAKEVAKILEENLHEPRENIARPAISALNNYGSEKHTREMFAKLIAASMDSTKDSIAHQSFVEIVKNMAPIDAKLLKIFSPFPNFPVAEVRLEVDEGFQTVFTNLFAHSEVSEDPSLVATSLTNLERLGIISIDYQSHLTNDSSYKTIESCSIYKDLVLEYERHKEFVASPNFYNTPIDIQEHIARLAKKKVVLKKGLMELTPLGKQFASICLSD
ncbi:hypothetical protein DOK67_0000156 [Enterococcus sp. DIV0212c]|uniref:DUF4393 domain-containing protein n=1 Tax=Enterococcus sp. DIV0212c TaxID=2230867 RepID=UPI001A9BAD11|nr:DUF4393 domain-containing protein [Enterococcus sp. DIV0212c]MBO1354005.1 DUF4393 domain-containing protein [Enterococcus sp. DIV0212c]